MRHAPATVVSLVAALAALSILPAPAEDPPAAAPASTAPTPEGSLNATVLEVMREYPIDGSFGYHWPRSGGWEGATQDVVWGGRVLAKGDPQRRSYCCGLTYEVWVRALQRANGGDVEGLDADFMHEARLRFFGDSRAGDRKKLVQFALESLKLGEAVPHAEARAGDFVQLWRHSGSGHQAVFMNWQWKGDQIVGLTYWSSQPSTRGIGFNSEPVSDTAIDLAQVYIGRAAYPLRR